ncbi:MAG: MFS transporter, partial [Coriobacteriales bacterium]|nr:MFS transporter [Coriobacteriales bacterium]
MKSNTQTSETGSGATEGNGGHLPKLSMPFFPKRLKNENLPPSLWTQGFVLAIAVNFLNFAGMQMLPTMLPLFIRTLGAPDYLLGTVAGIFSIASLVARPLAGAAVDNFGRRGMLTAGLIGMALCSIAFAIFPIVGAIIAFRLIQGLAWGAANTATSTVAADNIPDARHAEGFGYMGMTNSLALVVAP